MVSENICGSVCEVFSRVTGYFRPIKSWNAGKREEFNVRRVFSRGLVGSSL